MITFSGNAKTKNIPISTSKKVGNNFALIKKNAWLLWLSQCLNIAVISLELSHWMLAVIGLSLALQPRKGTAETLQRTCDLWAQHTIDAQE